MRASWLWLGSCTPLSPAGRCGIASGRVYVGVPDSLVWGIRESMWTREAAARSTSAWPQGLRSRELNHVRHHAVLGHGLAVQAIRDRARPAPRSVSPVPAAQRVTRELNAPYLTLMLE